MRILVTYGWCRTAYVTAESLARAGFEVFTCDPSPLSMTRVSRFVAGFDRVPDPFREPEGFVRAVSAIVTRRRIDLLLPMHEDAVAIQTYRAHLPPDLLIACPPLSDLSRAMDKYAITQIAGAAGVPVPRTVAPGGVEDVDQLARSIGFPLLIKTRRGNSGRGVWRIDSPAEVRRVYSATITRFALPRERLPILQAYVAGDAYGSCFLAQQGEMQACFVERYLRCKEEGFGTSVLREPYAWPLLSEYTARLVGALRWTGIGHFDFIGDGRQSLSLLEMNPRFWGALNLAVQNGYDFPRGLVTMLTTGKPDGAAFQPTPRPVTSLWIVGEVIASVAEFRRGKWGAPFASLRRLLFPPQGCTYDDFRWRDPLPLLIECAHYGGRFLASAGQVSPSVPGMMQ